jgi:bifunctional DNA-binding transcriptional regulator/antitoxin component of YhaV-PrlF toxin-antitoxin module
MIGPKHQITIPKEVFAKLKLQVRDYLEATVEGRKIVLTPKRLAEKAPTPRLSPAEQRLLTRAHTKIEQIQKDLAKARGLTPAEARVAAKVGLIDPGQLYWWTEAWQKGEREADSEIREGQVKSFERIQDFLQDLRS